MNSTQEVSSANSPRRKLRQYSLPCTALLFALCYIAQSMQSPATTLLTWGTGAWTNAPPLTNAIAVAAHSAFDVALKSDGTVVAWGGSVVTNVPPGLSNVVAVAAAGLGSAFISALRADGMISSWGTPAAINLPPDLWNAIGVTAGSTPIIRPFGAALKADGRIVVWGRPNPTALAQVPADLSNVVAIAAGAEHLLALKADGTVIGWGDNSYGQATGVPSSGATAGRVAISGQPLSNVTAIAAGKFHSLALLADGTMAGWGDNSYGQATGVATGGASNGLVTIAGRILSNVVAIASGPSANHSFGIQRDGTVVAWGDNQYGQSDIPHDLPFVLAASAAANVSLVLVDSNASTSLPTILRPPMAQTASTGSAVQLSVAAAGWPPLSYQWWFGTNSIPGATNSTLSLPNVQPGQSGSYSVIVSNLNGAVATPPAFVAVVPALDVEVIPALGFGGPYYPLEFTAALGSTNSWKTLNPVVDASHPQYQLDLDTIGQPQRFYRSSGSGLGINMVPALGFVGCLGSTNAYRLEGFDAAQGTWSPLFEVTITNQPQYNFDFTHLGRAAPPYRVLQPH